MSYRITKWCPRLQTIWENSPVAISERSMTSLQMELLKLEVQHRDSQQPPSPYSDKHYFATPKSSKNVLDDYESFDGESSDEEEEEPEVFTYPSDDEELDDYDSAPHHLAIQQCVRC